MLAIPAVSKAIVLQVIDKNIFDTNILWMDELTSSVAYEQMKWYPMKYSMLVQKDETLIDIWWDTEILIKRESNLHGDNFP